ncbi:MAG: hypothetical protein RL398_343 [Planctomycetota bacterium]
MAVAAALFLGAFASEDMTCIAAGALAMQGAIPLPLAVLACALGIFASDLALYWTGWIGARGVVRWQWLRRQLPASGKAAANWRRALDRHGFKILFVSRFLPGTRIPIYVAAGAIGWSLPRFAGALAIGAAVWTPLLVGTAFAFGESAQSLLDDYGTMAWLAVPVTVLCAFLVVRTVGLVASWRGRRMLRARWLRLTRWEYWPVWTVYPPVVFTLVWAAIRHRCVAPFTACNPGIPLGGLALESKGDILDRLPQNPNDPVTVTAYVRLRRDAGSEANLSIVADRLRRGPVVLKPDLGERGAGVAVVRDLEHARRWLEACTEDAIAQDYVGGIEFGVGWRRNVDGSTAIDSLTHKVLPTLVGDGERTLEELILADDRTLPMAAHHFAQCAQDLLDVPAAGEVVRLGELGTHARGATFLDVRRLITEELRQAFEGAMSRAEGLDFGRFDVRAPDTADLQAGRNIKILEFNGVTGEPTHIYQPGFPWWRGVTELCRHWLKAVETGRHNMARGQRAASATELLRLLGAIRKRRRFEAPQADTPASRNQSFGNPTTAAS